MLKHKLLTLFVVLCATTALWASNTITYTATEKLTEYKFTTGATTFGSTITSHTFSNGTGTIVCSGEITTIGEHAFWYCSNLTSITIPNSVTTIGDFAFAWCSALTSVIIPNSVTTIEIYAFYNCYNLTSVTIPNSVTTIGTGVFAACSGLTSVTIPNSVTAIRTSTFAGCSGITSITIPNSVTTIEIWAFYDCNGLTSVTIPYSVTTIGKWAFEYCSGLTSISCKATTPPTCEDDCFEGVDKSIPLYVPAGSIEAYQAAYQWKNFTDIRPITAEEVEVTEIETEPTESAVEIAWPSVVNAETYTIEIRLGDQLICSIVFNAQGQLVSINFNLAPGRGGHTYATTAESTATGWAYTIAGLNPGTKYTYSVIAKNADEQVIDTKSGSFTTKGVTAIENVSADVNTTKFLHNGQVIIRQGNKGYDAVGREVK